MTFTYFEKRIKKSFLAFLFILFISMTTLHSQVEKIADGFQFVEGPVWKDGVGLLFSDIPANKVYRWTPETGAEIFLDPSGNSNGLALDVQGRLLLAQHGNRRVARLETDGSQTALATHYDGKKLNSPNDLAVKSDGAIYFTDPPYGINSSQAELNFSGIFRISPTTGAVQLLDKSLYRPNGIALSPDETKLYVNDSEARKIYVWDIVDSTITNKKLFAYMNPAGNADGMKVDTEGNLYSTGPLGVWIFKPDGTVIDTVLVSGQTTNCGWGDADRKTLYITSGTAVYKIRFETTGFQIPGGSGNLLKDFKLFQNYPNPFNPSTTITFSLREERHVQLNVFDLLGKNIATLVDSTLTPGTKSYLWNANGINSGIYFCQLQAGEFSETGKMILLK
ncbi:MAG: SMP-30/gluconolactonase/LRE family protein [bacterium]